MIVEHAEAPLTLRPSLVARTAGWVIVVFGLLFALAGLVPDGSGPYDWGTALSMGTAGVVFLSLGLALSTAKATVTSAALRYRYGLIRRTIPAADVDSVRVGRGSGAYYPRICLYIGRHGRAKPVKLVALQRPDTAKSQAALERTAADMRKVLRTA